MPKKNFHKQKEKKKRSYSGRLYIVEGCDGSGKSTQLYLLKRYIESKGYTVFLTEWNSSALVKDATKQAKKKNLLTPSTFSLIHATDFADRYEKFILPALKSGYIVLADRYKYTAFARDVARGCNKKWLYNLYDFATAPDIAFYFKTDLNISLSRILSGRPALKFHEAGMDLGLHDNIVESFKIFQGRIKNEYDNMEKKFGFTIMDASLKIEEGQKLMREIVDKDLKDYKTEYKNEE